VSWNLPGWRDTQELTEVGVLRVDETDLVLNVSHFVLPRPTRQWLRRTYDALRFDAALRRFVANPLAALAPDSDLLVELISAWGNSGWIAQEGYLRACLTSAVNSTGPTLECGSGLSTLLLSVVAQGRGQEHWALEHLTEWDLKVRRCLARYRLHAVRLHTAPLKSYGDYAWYDPPLASLPRNFVLVVCDGPPADTVGGRYGLVPAMRDHLAPGCIILLDDAGREEERAIARRWEFELGASYHIVDDEKPFIRMIVPSRPACSV
jgi:hypothetical protein